MMITEIWRYPVKSIGGERLEHAKVTSLGIELDRAWGLFNPATSTVLTGRREPRLLLATASVTPGRLSIVTDDDRVIDGDIGGGAEDPGDDTGGGLAAMSDALSAWLGYEVELRRAGPTGGTFESPIDPETERDWVQWTGPPGAWHDSMRTRVSILSAGETGGIDPRRFRSNIIIDDPGRSEPTSIASWIGSDVQIGSVEGGVGLASLQAIDRCVMVGRAQRGLAADLDALRWVIRERSNLMGIGGLVTTPGRCAVGDPIGPSTIGPSTSGPSTSGPSTSKPR